MRSDMQKVDEHAFQEGRFGSGGRGGARDEIDELAVLHAIIGDALDLFVFGEIDREDPLVGNLRRHELHAAGGGTIHAGMQAPIFRGAMRLNQPQSLKARVAMLADDQMIMDGNI